MSEKLFLSTGGHIWSESSLRERPLSEQYPIKKGESKEEYEERLGLIDLYSENKDDANNSGTVEIAEDLDKPSKEYIFRKLGKLAIGYLFDLKERNPDMYRSEQTPDNMRKRGIFYLKQFEKLQPDAARLIKMNKGYFLKNIPNEMTPNGYINTASDFLNGKKRKDGNGYIFKDDVSRAKEKENAIKESREKWSLKQKETDFWSRVAEAYMYQFVSSYGLFDSPTGSRAYPIFPSKVDDFLNGVDCAFNIPVETDAGDVVYIPISLDLTTATTKQEDPSGKFSKFRDWAGGQTTLRYALEQTDREDEEGGELKIFKPQKLPNFVIGISRESIKKLIAPNPANGKSRRPSEELKKSIYRQIYQQCDLRMKYYGIFLNGDDGELGTEANNMKLLMDYFDKMSNNGSGKSASESERLVREWIRHEADSNPFSE